MNEPQKTQQAAPPLVPYYYPDPRDEVDLIDLVLRLWRGKKTIAAFCVGFLILAAVSLYFWPKKFESQARFAAPAVSELVSLIPIPLEGVEFQAADVFLRYFQAANSSRAKRDYYFSEIEVSDEVVISPSDLKELEGKVNLFSRNLSVSLSKNKDVLTMVFASDEPEKAQLTLERYVKWTSEQVGQDVLSDYKAVLSQKIAEIESDIAELREQQIIEQKSQKLELNEALVTARALGRKSLSREVVESLRSSSRGDEQVVLSFSGLPLYLLGEDVLLAELENLSARTEVDPYIEDLPVLRAQALKYQALLVGIGGKGDVSLKLRTLEQPNWPLSASSPKSLLVLVLALFVGFVVGVFYVLMASAISARR